MLKTDNLVVTYVYNLKKNLISNCLVFNLLLLKYLSAGSIKSINIHIKKCINKKSNVMLLKSPFHYKNSKSMLEDSNTLLLIRFNTKLNSNKPRQILNLGISKIKSLFNIQLLRIVFSKIEKM